MQTAIVSSLSSWGGKELASVRNRWIRYYEGKSNLKTHIDEIIQKVNENINVNNSYFIENMVRYITLASALLEGVLESDQVFIRLHDDTEEKITKNILNYIQKGETLGDDEFDTLVDRVLLLLKQVTSDDPKWKLANNTENNDVNFVIVEPDSDNSAEENADDKGKDVSFKDLMDYFISIVPDKKFQINKVKDTLELVIVDNNNYISFSIDPNIIIGNGYNILANLPNDGVIFVNLRHKELISKIINDKSYVLTPEEIVTVREDMFTNDSIYTYIDMSNMSENISKLTKEEFSTLGKKLTCVLNIPSISIFNNIPRMRFETFIDINEFTLVSDYGCLSPIDNLTSECINEGLNIKVSKDSIVVDLSDDNGVENYTINYGIM